MAKDSATLNDILLQARITNRLLAAQLKNEMQQNELIALLAGTGATPSEIAQTLGTSSATVSNALTRLRKKGKKT